MHLPSSTAFAQTSPTQQQVNPTVQDADKSRHKGRGGSQQGQGTHGHSSSPVPGETKDIQERQHSMPATPSHPSKPGSLGTSGQTDEAAEAGALLRLRHLLSRVESVLTLGNRAQRQSRSFVLTALLMAIAMSSASLLASPSIAAGPQDEMDEVPGQIGPPEQPLSRGRVIATSRDAGTITIEHRPIPDLYMEPMTMVLRVADPSLLEHLSSGDKIRFRVQRQGPRYLIIHIEHSNS